MKTTELYSGSVTRPYNGRSDSHLLVETQSIVTGMTGNPNFPDPTPDMPTFSAAVNAYSLQLSRAATRDAYSIAVKNLRRSELIDLCVQLSNSVENTANGDVDKLISSRLPLKKKPQSVVIGLPANLRITNGLNPGELVLKVNSMKGATSFNFTYTQDPPTETSVWVPMMCSRSRCVVPGLQSGKRYWFKVAAVGRKGQMVWGETLLSPYVQ